MGARSNCLIGLSCFLQVATATAIIVITALKLHKVSLGINSDTYSADVSNVCLLGSTENGANLCYFAYIAGGISVIATGVLSILQCCTCNLCGLGSILDALFAAAGTVLWAIAGVVFNYYGHQPAMQGVPQAQWRQAIPILSFVACGLFGLMCLASIWSVLSACCCGGSKRGSKGRKTDVEGGSSSSPAKLRIFGVPKQQQQQQQQFVYPQPAAYPPPAGYPAQGQFLVAEPGYPNNHGYWGTQASRF